MSGRHLTLALLAAALASVARAQAPADNLNLRFANGIAAIAEDKVITVDDVRREISPQREGVQRKTRVPAG
jgi:peptidyl-prolyl cis-trans isomerase SurA